MKKEMIKMVSILSLDIVLMVIAVATLAYFGGMADASPLLQWIIR